MKALSLGLLLLALIAPRALSQSAEASQLGRQVIPASLFQQAGARRLGDILTLIDDWDVSGVDGFTWQASPRGLSSLERPDWKVMIDGQLFDLDLVGVRSLDRLPVTLGQIDSVEVISAPAMVDGVFSDGGLIRIHARKPRDGVSVRASLASANETGDPGPYRFTDLATPNIDRIGTGVAGSVGFAGKPGYLALGARWQEHFVTDPPVRQRNFGITVADYPFITQGALSLEAALTGSGGRHAIYLGRSWTRDYFFLPQLGREVPVESPFNQASIDGSFGLTPDTRLRYRAAYSSNALDRHDNALDLDFDWELRRWRAGLEAVRHRPGLRAALGFTLEGASAETGYALADGRLTLIRAHGAVSYRLAESVNQTFAVQLTGGEGDFGLRAALTHLWSPHAGQTIEATMAWVERLPAEDGRVWLWLQRGYGFLSDAGVEVTRDGELETARGLIGDLRWRVPLADGLSLRLGTYVRVSSRLALDQQPFQFDSASQTFAGPVRLRIDQHGELGGAELAVEWSRRSLQVRTYYRYQDVLGGSGAYREAWRTVPRQRLRVSALYTPWPTLGLWAAMRYRTSTRWADYRLSAQQSGGRYSGKLDDALVLDLAVQKWLWKRRLRGHLLFQNVFNNAAPDHPIGAAYGLSFAVQGELQLDGL